MARAWCRSMERRRGMATLLAAVTSALPGSREPKYLRQRFVAELTLRDGKVVYDLNGITRPDWRTLPKGYTRTGDAAWDAITPATRKR